MLKVYVELENACVPRSTFIVNNVCGTVSTCICGIICITGVACETPSSLISFFYILLTVNHVMILGKWPTWRTILYYVFIFIFNSLHVSITSCSSSRETNRVNKPLVTVTLCVVCRSEVNFRPAHDTATDTEWQIPEVILTQIVTPDDEHDVLIIRRDKSCQYTPW
jgi:hypothetical protein